MIGSRESLSFAGIDKSLEAKNATGETGSGTGFPSRTM